jgi:hypothetical protein
VVRLTTTAVPFPDSVQALIAAWLDRLPAAGKALIQDAAVAGLVFWSGALAALAGTAEPAVRAGLAELEAKELVRPVRPSSVEGQAEYRFSHGLVRYVAYAQLPRARRHRAVAAWLGGLARSRVAGSEDDLAGLREPAGRALELARRLEVPELEVRSLTPAGWPAPTSATWRRRPASHDQAAAGWGRFERPGAGPLVREAGAELQRAADSA